MTTDELVNAAAAFLDERLPGWWQRVNVDMLHMTSMDLCVLGQLYGVFTTGLEELQLDASPLHAAFWALGSVADLVEREHMWKELIRARQDATLSVSGDGPAGADEPCYVGVRGNVLHE